MSGKICVKDIDLRKLVEELWKNAEYSVFCNQSENQPEFDWKVAMKQIKPGGFLEHVCGMTSFRYEDDGTKHKQQGELKGLLKRCGFSNKRSVTKL